MVSNAQNGTGNDSDAPSRKTPAEVAARYNIGHRTAGEVMRAAVAAGVLSKRGGKKRSMTIGRWSALDAFFEGGAIGRRRRSP